MDCEVLQHIQRYMEPATYATTPDDIALDAIEEVGPNGHFFGIQHPRTLYHCILSAVCFDWRNFEAWDAAGGVWTPERAHKIYKQILAEFEAPHMDEAIKEELKDFVDRRKAEGGAPTDF